MTVLDRRRTLEESRARRTNQPVVAHDLLSISRKRAFVGSAIALMFPEISERAVLPSAFAAPGAAGKAVVGMLGTKPELSTETDEFRKPVPFPLQRKQVRPTTATAEGY